MAEINDCHTGDKADMSKLKIEQFRYCIHIWEEVCRDDFNSALPFLTSMKYEHRDSHGIDQVIETPMDLGTIKAKLENNKYKNMEEFASDMRLIFSTCYKYNSANTLLVTKAQKLQHLFELMYARTPEELLESPPSPARNKRDTQFTLPPSKKRKVHISQNDSDNESTESEKDREARIQQLQDRLSSATNELNTLVKEQISKAKKRVEKQQSMKRHKQTSVVKQLQRQKQYPVVLGEIKTEKKNTSSKLQTVQPVNMHSTEGKVVSQTWSHNISQIKKLPSHVSSKVGRMSSHMTKIKPRSACEAKNDNEVTTHGKKKLAHEVGNHLKQKIETLSIAQTREHLTTLTDAEEGGPGYMKKHVGEVKQKKKHVCKPKYHTVTMEEKIQLMHDIEKLPQANKKEVLCIVETTENTTLTDGGEEVEIDFEFMKQSTLLALQAYVKNYYRKDGNDRSKQWCLLVSDNTSQRKDDVKNITRPRSLSETSSSSLCSSGSSCSSKSSLRIDDLT